jgi:hypothetical protein
MGCACGEDGKLALPPDGSASDGGSSVARRSLRVEGAAALTLAPGERVDLKVVLLENEWPLAGAPVRFRLEGAGAGAMLGSAGAETDGWGRAATTLLAGTEARFEVRAEADGAQGAAWSVAVVRPGHGDLAVTARFAGSAGVLAVLGSGRARAYAEPIRCASLTARGPSPTAAAEAPLAAPDGTARLGRLPVGTYTIGAWFVARERAVALAWGCVENVLVRGGETREVTVKVEPVPLVLLGPYSVVAHYDLRHAVPGAVGEFARGVAAAFDDRDASGRALAPPADDPGYFIADLLWRETFGEPNELAIGILAVLVNRVISDVPWLSTAAEIGTALAEAMARLEVRSELVLEKHAGEGLTARERWESVVVHFRGQPHVLSLVGGLADGAGAGPAVEAQMSAVDLEGSVRFLSHRLRLAYGRLALRVLEQVVLPALAGVRSLREALGALVDCAVLAEVLADAGLPIPAPVCEAALDAAALLARAALDRLVAEPAALRREGSARAVDADLDAQAVADRLESGRWQGTLEVGGESLRFGASWTAGRRGH